MGRREGESGREESGPPRSLEEGIFFANAWHTMARGQCWFREVMGLPPWEAQEGPEGQTTGLGVSESQRTAQVELGLVSRGWGVLSTGGGRATTRRSPRPPHTGWKYFAAGQVVPA